ncbi:fec operon regulator FecR [Caulifigura coniformis]|uniref:Fec operon regulator FecR n=1 Tax=Caulifigura coniformis TaxID=2527983 RepID=A0A517S8K0_9PLAN|nr:FecR family protein [Caulifigura coniformis]QDT52433.1 fec operon regulator FecR [Caulifigura coniformis]
MPDSPDQDIFIARFLEGSLSDEELVEASALMEDPEFADRVVRNSRVQELLLKAGTEIHGAESHDPSEASLSLPPDHAFRSPARRSVRTRLIACTLAMSACAGWFLFTRPSPAVATVSRSVNAVWKSGEKRWSVGDQLRAGDSLTMQEGRAELLFKNGAVMVLDGDVSMKMVSAESVALLRGSATTRLDKAKGGAFDVQTPSAHVVDLGTEFGVRVQDDGNTDVVVFEGAVDIRPRGDRPSPSQSPQRLDVGEALHSKANGPWERLVSVTDDAFPSTDRLYPVAKTRAPIIASISDNRRPGDKPKFYRICHEGFVEDARAFVDMPYEWNGLTAEGLPAFLRGADYVQTFNTDRSQSSLNITVELAAPAMLYILYDNRILIPEWLASGFEDTGVDIGLDEEQGRLRQYRTPLEIGGGKGIDQTCSVWARRVDSTGPVVVGPVAALKPEFAEAGRTMLGIVAQPLPPLARPHDRDAAE